MSDILQAKTITGEYSGLADSALRTVSSIFLTAVPEGYATEAWVTAQGYLTAHQDLSGYQTTAGMTAYQPAGAYLTSIPDSYLQNTDLTITDNKVTAISGVPLAGGGGNITTANTGYDYKIGIDGVDVYGTMTTVSGEPIYRFNEAITDHAFYGNRNNLYNNEGGIEEVNTHYYSISACDSVAFIITNIDDSFSDTEEVEFTPVFSAKCLDNNVSLTVPLDKMYFSQTALPGVTGPKSAVSAKINIPSEWSSNPSNIIRYNLFLSSWSSHGREYDRYVLQNCDFGYGFGSAQVVDVPLISGIFIPEQGINITTANSGDDYKIGLDNLDVYGTVSTQTAQLYGFSSLDQGDNTWINISPMTGMYLDISSGNLISSTKGVFTISDTNTFAWNDDAYNFNVVLQISGSSGFGPWATINYTALIGNITMDKYNGPLPPISISADLNLPSAITANPNASNVGARLIFSGSQVKTLDYTNWTFDVGTIVPSGTSSTSGIFIPKQSDINYLSATMGDVESLLASL